MKTKILQAFKTFKGYLFASDKWLHLAAGYAIATYIGVFCPIAGLATAIIIGVLKEINDRLTKKGTPELWDFLFTVLGAVVAFLNILLLRWAFNYIGG